MCLARPAKPVYRCDAMPVRFKRRREVLSDERRETKRVERAENGDV